MKRRGCHPPKTFGRHPPKILTPNLNDRRNLNLEGVTPPPPNNFGVGGSPTKLFGGNPPKNFTPDLNVRQNLEFGGHLPKNPNIRCKHPRNLEIWGVTPQIVIHLLVYWYAIFTLLLIWLHNTFRCLQLKASTSPALSQWMSFKRNTWYQQNNNSEPRLPLRPALWEFWWKFGYF